MKAMIARDKPNPSKTARALVPLFFTAEEMMNRSVQYTKNGRDQKEFVSKSSLAALLGENMVYDASFEPVVTILS